MITFLWLLLIYTYRIDPQRLRLLPDLDLAQKFEEVLLHSKSLAMDLDCFSHALYLPPGIRYCGIQRFKIEAMRGKAASDGTGRVEETELKQSDMVFRDRERVLLKDR